MNYLVFIKQVPDTATRFQLKEENQKVDLSSVKWVINPYDEFAIEEALRMSEKDQGQVEICTLGPSRCKEALRTALAMGAHKGIHIESESLDSWTAVQVVYSVLKEKLQEIGVILCGKQSVDWGFSAFGPMLGQLLGWPSVSPVNKILKKEQLWEIHRAMDGGQTEILEIQGPVVLSVTKGINQPRYPSLPGIMKAKNKPIEVYSASHSIHSSFSIESLEFPKPRPPVQMIEGTAVEQAQELVRLLREKEHVL